MIVSMMFFFFSSRRRHTRCGRDWSSDVCSSDLGGRGTATWYLAHREGPSKSLQQCLREWEDEHAGLHGYGTLRTALDRRFRERFFAWRPYLHHYPEVHAGQKDEQESIAAGLINPIA